ncbi:MAG: hypothetical protein AB8B78_04385 [Polaribacter sp.]
MNNVKNLFLGLVLSTVFVFSACSSSADDALNAVCTEAGVEAAAEAIQTELLAFTNDPTSAKCNAVKTAMSNFINTFENCPQVTASDLAEAKKQLAELQCP